MSKKNSDQLFSDLLQRDQIGEPDRSLENRLMHSFLLKSGSSKSRQNSLSSFLGWLVSVQSIGLKAGLASVILFLSIMNSQINIKSDKITGSDSLYTKRVLVADSTSLNRSLDSLRTDSLYY